MRDRRSRPGARRPNRAPNGRQGAVREPSDAAALRYRRAHPIRDCTNDMNVVNVAQDSATGAGGERAQELPLGNLSRGGTEHRRRCSRSGLRDATGPGWPIRWRKRPRAIPRSEARAAGRRNMCPLSCSRTGVPRSSPGRSRSARRASRPRCTGSIPSALPGDSPTPCRDIGIIPADRLELRDCRAAAHVVLGVDFEPRDRGPVFAHARGGAETGARSPQRRGSGRYRVPLRPVFRHGRAMRA